MADFAHWISACETSLWPAGTFARAYAGNRRAAIESVIDGDAVASRIRDIMVQRNTWTGTAAELVHQGAQPSDENVWSNTGWPKSPRALAGQLRRAQPSLRSLGIYIVFSRQGREGSRTITMTRNHGKTVCTVGRFTGDEHRP